MALGQLTSLTSLYARHCPQLGSLAPLSTLTQLLALNLASSDFGTLGDISGKQISGRLPQIVQHCHDTHVHMVLKLQVKLLRPTTGVLRS